MLKLKESFWDQDYSWGPHSFRELLGYEAGLFWRRKWQDGKEMPASPRRLDLEDLAAALRGGVLTEAGEWLATQLPTALDMYRIYMDPCGDAGDTEDWLQALAAITAGMDRMDNAQAAGPQSEPIVV